MNRNLSFAFAGLLALAGAHVIAAPAWAEEKSFGDYAPGVMVKKFTMGVGRSVIIELPRDAAEVFIGEPKYANAIVRSPRQLYVVALDNGQSTIMAIDAQGKQIAVIEVSIGRNIEELSQLLKKAMPRSDIRMSTVNDTIILSGTVDTPGEAQQAADIAKGFVSSTKITGEASHDGKVINTIAVRGRDQVTVRLVIAEIRRDISKQFGFTSTTATGAWGSLIQDNPLVLNTQQLSATALSLGGNNLTATIRAFERQGFAKVLAEPSVTTVSGENAKFTAGGELPIVSGFGCQSGICSLGYTYKPYGVTLNFTPVVLGEGRILLRIATEASEVDPQNQIVFSGGGQNANVPAFLTRKNETTVELPSGGSIATAGLIQTLSAQVINGLPGLMNLPIIGALFRSRDFQRHETELMIIATPYIVKPVQAKELARPIDNLADATDPQAILLGRVNRLYTTTSNPQVIQNFKGKVGFIND